MSRVLVTGGDGFIGSHLVEHLLRAGHEVRAMAQYNSFGNIGWLAQLPTDLTDGVEIVSADVRDPMQTFRAVDGCDVVFHLAALIGIPYSYVAPASYIDTNVTGTLNVLEAARHHETRRVLVTSTSEVYGSAQRVPIDEDHPLVGQSPYSASKIGGDQLALSFWRSFQTPVTVVRPFNTYGPRQSTRAVIPTVVTQIARGKRTIQLGSLTPTRDFSFVADTARAFDSAAASDDALGEVINFGSGFEISIADTVKEIAAVMGADVEVVQDPERIRPDDSEVDRLFADISLAKKLCGWTPEFGGLEGFRRGLTATCEWFAVPENLAAYREGYRV